jgi:hypothetical protein
VRDARLIPAEALLAGIGLVPPPASLAVHSAIAPAALGWSAQILKALIAKPVAAIAVGTAAVTGAGVVYMVYPAPHPAPHVSLPTPQPRTASATAAASGPPAPPPTTAAPATTFTAALLYGSVVDMAEAAPPKAQKPGALPVRPAGGITVTGVYEAPKGNTVIFQQNHRGDYLTLRGEGYFRIRWQIVYTAGRVGTIVMPTWTGLVGKLFHVASGGGRRMDDALSGSGPSASTGMGSPSTGFDTVPAGAQQMWQNEYYYLDGTVVLHQNQGWAEAGYIVQAMSWQQIDDDVNMAPGDPGWVLRYGVVRDTGTDTAPVPQYVTRGTPSDPAGVAQRSAVS